MTMYTELLREQVTSLVSHPKYGTDHLCIKISMDRPRLYIVEGSKSRRIINVAAAFYLWPNLLISYPRGTIFHVFPVNYLKVANLKWSNVRIVHHLLISSRAASAVTQYV